MSAEEENKNQTSTPENDSTSSETANNSGSDTQNSGSENTSNQNTSNKSDSSSTDSARSSADKSSETKSEVKADAKKLEHEPEAKGKESDLTKVGKSDSKFKAKAKNLGRKAGNHVKEGVKSRAQNFKDAVNNSVFINRLKKMFQIIKKVVKFIITHIKIIAIVTGIILVVGGLVLTVISMSEASGETPHYYCDIDAEQDLKKTAFYRQYCSNGSLNLASLEIMGALIWANWICADQRVLYSLEVTGAKELVEWEGEGQPMKLAYNGANYICCATFVSICLYKVGLMDNIYNNCQGPRKWMNKNYSLSFDSSGREIANREGANGWEYVGGLCYPMYKGLIDISTEEFSEKYIDGGLQPGDVILYRHDPSTAADPCTDEHHSHITLCAGLNEDPTSKLNGKYCEYEAAGNHTTNGKGYDDLNIGQDMGADAVGGTNDEVLLSAIEVDGERTVEVWRYTGNTN